MIENPPPLANERREGGASKSCQLRRLIESESLAFLMEAHNGLSAKIAEQTGFEALWASGLSMSAALGVRDNNEATWTQLLEVLEFMSDATSIPILFDGDTGFGDFNTMRRVVRKLEARQIAGVCIEDKIFPKTNSFINGHAQPLANVEEFCGKIRAGKSAQQSDEFVIVARVEAFIAGWGLDEAMRRAEAYHDAGADAILMHSALRKPDEVFAFAERWNNRCPVILVPTKYYATPTEAFRQHNIAAVIWANHSLRASVRAMQAVTSEIYESQNLTGVEDKICPVGEVFRLQGADELADAEKQFLPTQSSSAKAFILGFARGVEMGELTSDRPKTMVPVAGKPILRHIVNTLRQCDLKQIGVIAGYCHESVDVSGITKYVASSFERMDDALALSSAMDDFEGETLIVYGDVLFRKFVATSLLDSEADFCVMIDTHWEQSRNKDRYADYVVCSSDPASANFHDRITLSKVVNDSNATGISGEWMGLLKTSRRGTGILKSLICRMQSEHRIDGVDMASLMNSIVASGHSIEVLYTVGNWIDCDNAADAIDGSEFAER